MKTHCTPVCSRKYSLTAAMALTLVLAMNALSLQVAVAQQNQQWVDGYRPASTVRWQEQTGQPQSPLHANDFAESASPNGQHDQNGLETARWTDEPPATLFQWNSARSNGNDSNGEEENGIEPLVTDRPDFTESSSTVGCGVLQLEMGYTYTFDDDGTLRTSSHSGPETLLRYGVLANWFELRAGWNYAGEESAAGNVSGSEDIYLGAKIALVPQDGALPEMALIPQMTVPTGSTAFTADEVLPGVNWTYSWDLNDFLSTAGSTQFNRAVDDGTSDAYTEWAQSWTIGYSLSECVGAYTEWYAFFPHSADTALPEYYFNGGLTRLFSDDVQWDIRAGVGLNDAADDYFAGTGLSIRWR